MVRARPERSSRSRTLDELSALLARGCVTPEPMAAAHRCVGQAVNVLAAVASVDRVHFEVRGPRRTSVTSRPGSAPPGTPLFTYRLPGRTSGEWVELALAGSTRPALSDGELRLVTAGLARLAAECERRRYEPDPFVVAKVLGDISEALSNNVPIETLLERLVAAAGRLLRADRSSIFLYDERTQKLFAHVAWGVGGPPRQLGTESTDFERRIIAELRPVMVTNASAVKSNPYFHAFGIKSSLGIPMIAAGHLVGMVLFHTISRRRRFTQEDILIGSAFANDAAVAILNNRLYERIRTSHARMLALYQAGRAVGRSLDPADVARALLRAAHQLTGASAVVLQLPGSHAQALTFPTSESLRAWRTSLPENVRTKIHQARPNHSVQVKDWDSRTFHASSVPIDLGEEGSGWLELYGEDAAALAEAHASSLALAQHASTTLRNARLYRVLAETRAQLATLVEQLITAREDESRRVAYDVHDGLGQVLVAADQRLQAALHAGDQQELDVLFQELAQGRQLVAHGIREARAIVNRLRPPGLDEFGLTESIRGYCLELGRHYEVDIRVDAPDLPVRLPGPVEVVLFRVLQEALANAIRHGQARVIRVCLQVSDTAVTLSIRDDGRGLRGESDAPGATGSGVGLVGMRERLRLVGGSLALEEPAEGGVCLTATVPRDPQAERLDD